MPLTKTKDETLKKNCDFSYSGLKTNIKTLFQKLKEENKSTDDSQIK